MRRVSTNLHTSPVKSMPHTFFFSASLSICFSFQLTTSTFRLFFHFSVNCCCCCLFFYFDAFRICFDLVAFLIHVAWKIYCAKPFYKNVYTLWIWFVRSTKVNMMKIIISSNGWDDSIHSVQPFQLRHNTQHTDGASTHTHTHIKKN